MGTPSPIPCKGFHPLTLLRFAPVLSSNALTSAACIRAAKMGFGDNVPEQVWAAAQRNPNKKRGAELSSAPHNCDSALLMGMYEEATPLHMKSAAATCAVRGAAASRFLYRFLAVCQRHTRKRCKPRQECVSRLASKRSVLILRPRRLRRQSGPARWRSASPSAHPPAERILPSLRRFHR